MSVPQELIDVIVDNLHDDIPSLKSCALTARAFVGSAQTHIFQRVEINPPRDRDSASPTPCQNFHKLLISSPHIAPLVTDLSIVLVGSETSFGWDEYTGEYLQDRQVTWIMAGRTLALVLPLLDLKRISLIENGPAHWNSDGEFSMKWNGLPRQLKSALTDLFSSPRLEAVHLRGLVIKSPNQLLALFSEASALKDLSLSRIFFTTRRDKLTTWPDSRPWRPQLTSLLISDEPENESLVRYFTSPQIHLGTIKVLALPTATTGNAIISTVTGLEHLRLYYIHTYFGFSAILLSTTANLRSIHCNTTMILELLGSFFTLCPPDSSIETVTLEGPVTTTDGVTQRLDLPVHLRSLRMVEIKTKLKSESSTYFPVWSAAVRALLPSLEARGMLTITQIQFNEFEPEHGWE
ncbi:hypothetical protein C8R46DRAFT_1076136 [Mycena filopes]|nr:hypothetical protein C8R46DRAFT_1076136 [Mycena filopes]